MESLLLMIAKYVITFLMAMYAFSCFNVFRYKTEYSRRYIYFRQNIYMLLIYTVAFIVMLIKTMDVRYFYFYLVSMSSLVIIITIYKVVYKRSNRLIVNNMCMLLSVGFIILARLSFYKATRQYAIAMISVILTGLIPFIISKGPFFSKLKWVYVIAGLGALSAVLVFSATTFGAKINISVMGVTFQPSEFVKIIFIFAIASFLSEATDFKHICVTTAIAGAHVIILVLSKDLGGAVILFVVYLCMLYVATCNILYCCAGIAAGACGAVIGYKLFSHVRVRVQAFLDPLGTISNAGYQISQSLFAIGTGGFFGMGLMEGAPEKIPVVAADFVFSAISEELGGFFSMCLILICLSCFVMFMNISMRFENRFYKYVALGLGILYGFQVLLTIGGVTKFIPLTGVTLPLISYGGTSVLVTMVMFSIIQGLYIGRGNESLYQ